MLHKEGRYSGCTTRMLLKFCACSPDERVLLVANSAQQAQNLGILALRMYASVHGERAPVPYLVTCSFKLPPGKLDFHKVFIDHSVTQD